ncbi:sensor histidine kinase, partial [Arsukibacterium sp.]|uniref:sensor histidine kinase n=1 Tax=Arsukibacterium sp. TaxID=1977258 RepID=UPI002FDB5161
IQIEVDEHLAWYFDRELIIHVLNDVFVNALRYCRQRILVQVSVEQQQLVLAVNDDGPGFPDFMLQAVKPDMSPPDLQHSHTGLGLYFARLIAAAHKNQGQHGSVQLRNNSELGGGVFVLQLP